MDKPERPRLIPHTIIGEGIRTDRIVASQSFWVTIAVILIPIVMALAESTFSAAFWKEQNFFNITRNFAFIAIMALGQVAVIITGGIDLSVGSVLAVCGIVLGLLLTNERSFRFSSLAAIVAGLLCGWVKGYLIAWIEVDGCPLITDDDSTKAVQQPQDMLGKYADLDVFITTGAFTQWSDNAFRQAIEPYKDNPKSGKLVFVSADTLSMQMQQLTDGLSNGQVGQRPFQMGYLAMERLLDLKQGKTLQDPEHTGLDVCTPENADSCLGNWPEPLSRGSRGSPRPADGATRLSHESLTRIAVGIGYAHGS